MFKKLVFKWENVLRYYAKNISSTLNIITPIFCLRTFHIFISLITSIFLKVNSSFHHILLFLDSLRDTNI